MLTEDLSHWHSMGIYTVEDFWASMALEDAKEARKASYALWEDEVMSDDEFYAQMRAEAEAERAIIADEREERVWARIDAIQDGSDFRSPRMGSI
jgi:uridine phosphorylase